MAVVTIEELDPASLDEATLAQLAELATIEAQDAAPDDPPVTVAETADDLRLLAAFEEVHLWVARGPDGRLLGRASLWIEHREENRHLAALFTVVRPEERRGGLGRRLLEVAAERARSQGRTTLMGMTVVGTEGAAAVRALGAEVALVNRISRLRTAELDRSLLETWVTRAPERAAGYSLLSFESPTPEHLREPFASLMAVMNTAPRGDMDMEDEVVTPALMQEFEASMAAKGTRLWTVAARHDASGELAGYSTLFIEKHRPWQVHQGDTGVVPAHRNKGLGRWLKAVNLLRLLDERPEAEVVDTENAGSNEPMLNINVALGFRPLAETESVQLKLN
jgi:mycothiol synthase